MELRYKDKSLKLISYGSSSSNNTDPLDMHYGLDWVTGDKLSLPGLTAHNVAYGNGVFVILSTNYSTKETVCSTSSDLLNWTNTIMPSGLYQNSEHIFFVHDRFILSRTRSPLNTIYWSTDGIEWTEYTFPDKFLSQILDIEYGNGYWMVNWNGDIPYISQDFVNWHFAYDEEETSPFPNDTLGSCFYNGYFWFPFNNYTIYKTADFVTWETISVPKPSATMKISSMGYIQAHGNQIVCIPYDTNFKIVSYSENSGVTWKTLVLPKDIADLAVVASTLLYADGRWFVFAGTDTAKNAYFFYADEEDLSTWKKIPYIKQLVNIPMKAAASLDKMIFVNFSSNYHISYGKKKLKQ